MQKYTSILKSLYWLTLFSLAISYLESAVVVYLRELYYPSGFDFPLVMMKESIAVVEILRELSTLIIIFSIAMLAGNNLKQRVAWFFYIFAVWDIGYYLFLKILLNWPESLMTWDILFLIPTTWTGPVIAPLLVSFAMTGLTALLLRHDNLNPSHRVDKTTWIVLITGATVVFVAFIFDYSNHMLKHCSLSGLFDPAKVADALALYIPAVFCWWLFLPGLAIILFGFFRLFKSATHIAKV